ncbi:MAG: MBL fold metallo-hydrolase [Acidobacteriota bacterium]
MSRDWLSNTYLVADREGGHGVLVDTGGPDAPVLAWIDELRLTITHVLCTHHHIDHVAHNGVFKARFGCPVCAHRAEAPLLPGLDVTLADGDEIRSGGLAIRAIHIPGHTAGQAAFLVNEESVFTGDTLFRGSVGGTRAPGHTTFQDLHHSIMEILMRLRPGTLVHPGHTDPSTIGSEWDENPFIQMWRGRASRGTARCKAFGRPATLYLRAEDYDGGTKCWVRFDEGGVEDVVPGSQVEDL